MAYAIPKETDYVLREGDRGVVVWALQRTCNKLGIPTSEDGAFGPSTVVSAKAIQIMLKTAQDGIVGPTTQRLLAEHLCRRQESRSHLYNKLLLSLVMYETGGYLGAVNYNKPGGVDCGLVQRRVYDFQLGDDQAVKDAFDAAYQLGIVAADLKLEYARIMARGVVRKSQTGWRLAILDHNYPALADAISRNGFKRLSSYYTTPQDWTILYDGKGNPYRLKFPDGHEVRTPLEWGQRYALGNPDHSEPGQAVKLVEWT